MNYTSLSLSKKKLLVLFLLLNYVLISQAQEKHFTAEDASYNNPALYPKGLSNLSWIPETDFYAFTNEKALIKKEATKETSDTLIFLQQFNQLLVQNNEKAGKGFPRMTWINKNEFRFQKGNKFYLCNPESQRIVLLTQIPENAGNVDISESSQHIAYTLDNNLYINLRGEQRIISDEKNSGILYGSERVYRNEWGISKGTFWSPDGTKLAFYRMDETMVTDYPIIDITSRPAKVNNIKYPMAGMPIHHVTVGVYNILTQKTVYLNTPEPSAHYLTNITWSPDNKSIYIAVLNREQNHLWLNCYDVSTGNLKRILFEETSPRYVEPENGPWFMPANPAQFVWQSERDGYNHLYLYDTSGNLIKQLTKGNWEVQEISGYSQKLHKFIILSTKDSPLESNIFTVDIRNNEVRRINEEGGSHSVKFNSYGDCFLDIYSNSEVPLKIRLNKLNAKIDKIIFTAENPLKDYKLGETTVFTIKNDDNDDLYCRMITPPDFDTSKIYPVIVYVYGGPHNQLIRNSWLSGAGIYLNYLSQRGYIVFSLDNRGSANRGFEFESVIHRHVGMYEVEDQICGINYLKQLHYVDTTRIGLDGWSYGGFMVINLMLQHPQTFKAGCAGGPVCDWKYYEAMYGERYMDTPEENPEGYQNSSLLSKANCLNRRLLVIHCTTDPVVVWQNSIDFVQKCIEKGILLDYFIYPGHDHNV
ncbi:MAG TPA: DPP IV N-terminal domain-containing protein, partial [Bacteroidales bacterium]|nr:DPP IV N-terminal domain-containing protein [Bacteroidales bacterium]HOR04700.1 DPP IV N-terminal domain-containing protein [Bacteroidales bacterium]HPA28784.1 DPP IV N-terminal domain-containing protein [Bacteroidales bacterium]HPC13443.1 DPP IV N-terminal domain-containing protein [Bacteroidales bacterium]HQI64654.1 DPP IV N-terminal domain-containing protein [Bacteroidales bacterium]